jgi:hypothetical protein
MEKTIVAQAVENQAAKSGALFAKSELDASQAMEIFARELGTEPNYTNWITNRTDWVNGYVTEKPQAKGNSADQAFTRFARRLNESFGIVAPKAQTEASIKKATERAKKAEELAQKYELIPTHQITENLKQAYELQAKNPTKKMATLKELENILKARTKAEESGIKEELKTARNRLFQLAKACTDVARIETASDILDEVNYEYEVQA